MSAGEAPLVSLVTPSYGQAAYVEETIRSVLDQDYPRIEYIVVDGGSTDGSVDVVRRYADRLAWWVSEPDRGQADALNKGFARATGDILGYVNSDDTLLPGAVAAAVEELERHPDALLVYGGVYEVDADGTRLRYAPPHVISAEEMLRTSTFMISQQGMLFRRRAWELAGPFNVDRHYLFDAEFTARVALAGEVRALDRPLGTYRLHDESKTVVPSESKALEYPRLVEDLFARSDLPDAIRAHRGQALSNATLWSAMLLHARGDERGARAQVVRGLRLHPRNVSARWLGLLARTLVPSAARRRLRRGAS